MADEKEIPPVQASSGEKRGPVAKVEAEVSEEAAKVAAQTAKIEAAVGRWMDRHIRNSPVARATAAWNHLQSKVGELVAEVMKEV